MIILDKITRMIGSTNLLSFMTMINESENVASSDNIIISDKRGEQNKFRAKVIVLKLELRAYLIQIY